MSTASVFEFRKNNFDLIRILAALQVAVVHGLHHFGFDEKLPWLGHALSLFPGVPIFFVVSGFLISASWERSQSSGSYFLNRFLRIYPGLWVCFLVSLVTVYLFYSPVFTFKEMASWILAQISIVQFYNPDFLRGYGVGVLNGSLWTIPVELQFYLVLPFIYAAFDRLKWNKWIVAVFFGLLVIVSQLFVYRLAGRGDFVAKLAAVTVVPYLYMFFFGVLLQRSIPLLKKYLAGKAICWLGAYAAVQLVASKTELHFSGNLINPVSYVVLAAFIISFAYSYTDKFGELLKGNDISYGYYIYHMVFVNALLQLGMFSSWVNLALMLLLTLAAAILSWRFVEKPLLAFKKFSIKK